MIVTSANIKQFIDWILDFGYLFRNFILPKGLFDPDRLSKMNFVGIHECMQETIERLRIKIGMPDLSMDVKNHVVYENDYSHRYDELKEFFADEFVVYNNYLQAFHKSS
jgi:hypothetical protein